MKCTGMSNCQTRVFSCRTTGISATTMGNSRTLDRLTATAVSNSAVPGPSPVTRMTCAGPAHCSAVDSIAQPIDRP